MSEAMGILSSKAQEDTNVESKTANDGSVKVVDGLESQLPDESSQQVESESKPAVDITTKASGKENSISETSQDEVAKSDDNEKSSEKTDEMTNAEDSKTDKIEKPNEVTSEVSSEVTSTNKENTDETKEPNVSKEEKNENKEEPQADTIVDADLKEAPIAGSKRKDSPVKESDDESSAQIKRTKVDAVMKCVEDVDKTITDDAPKDAVVA